jgi:putative transcription factor
MCGKEVESLTRTRVEGSILRLCADCQKFGTVLDEPARPMATPPPTAAPGRSSPWVRPPPKARSLEERDLFTELPAMELAEDWPKRIRAAREKLAWTPEEFGKRLNEKKSLVLKLEAGHFRPPDQTIHKIEKLLKIRLRADAVPPG